MFATRLNLMQLAFGNPLNILYTGMFLAVLGLLALRMLRLRRLQSEWEESWGRFSTRCLQKLQGFQECKSPQEWHDKLRESWLGDLSARLAAAMPLPEPQEATESVMQEVLDQEPSLDWEGLEPQAERWERLPGVAILLGLLGTFFGLTAALTQLPFRGTLSQLTGGLQEVLPLMGTAFWTSVCGLVASLIIRLANTFALRAQDRRWAQTNTFTRSLRQRILHDLYPRLREEGMLALPAAAAPAQEAVQAPQSTEDLSETLREALSAQFAPLQETLTTLSENLQKLSPLGEELQTTAESLAKWRDALGASQEAIQAATVQLEPIAHTERLLNERIVSLTRQHQALSETIEQLERVESSLPDKMRDLIKFTLRPAHQLLQRTSNGLHQLFDKQLTQQSKDREEWRQLLSELNDKFVGIDRISHTTKKMTEELARATDTLLEISTRIRFRPPAAPQNEDGQNDPLEAEIDQLLEGFDDPNYGAS